MNLYTHIYIYFNLKRMWLGTFLICFVNIQNVSYSEVYIVDPCLPDSFFNYKGVFVNKFDEEHSLVWLDNPRSIRTKFKTWIKTTGRIDNYRSWHEWIFRVLPQYIDLWTEIEEDRVAIKLELEKQLAKHEYRWMLYYGKKERDRLKSIENWTNEKARWYLRGWVYYWTQMQD